MRIVFTNHLGGHILLRRNIYETWGSTVLDLSFELGSIYCSTDEAATEAILKCKQSYANLCGKLGMTTPRDAFITALCKASLPPHYTLTVLQSTSQQPQGAGLQRSKLCSFSFLYYVRVNYPSSKGVFTQKNFRPLFSPIKNNLHGNKLGCLHIHNFSLFIGLNGLGTILPQNSILAYKIVMVMGWISLHVKTS